MKQGPTRGAGRTLGLVDCASAGLPHLCPNRQPSGGWHVLTWRCSTLTRCPSRAPCTHIPAGHVSAPLQAFLTGTLSEPGLRRLAKTVDAAVQEVGRNRVLGHCGYPLLYFSW